MTCKIPQMLSINMTGRRKNEFSELSQYVVVREDVPNSKSLGFVVTILEKIGYFVCVR